MPDELTLDIRLSRTMIPTIQQPQLVYVLFDIQPAEGTGVGPAAGQPGAGGGPQRIDVYPRSCQRSSLRNWRGGAGCARSWWMASRPGSSATCRLISPPRRPATWISSRLRCAARWRSSVPRIASLWWCLPGTRGCWWATSPRPTGVACWLPSTNWSGNNWATTPTWRAAWGWGRRRLQGALAGDGEPDGALDRWLHG